MSLLQQDPDLFAFAYAGITVIGGAIGYLKASSTESLVSSLLSGGAIAYGAQLLRQPSTARTGHGIILATALVLGAFFTSRFLSSKKVMPGGIMAALSIAAVIRHGRVFL